MTPLDSLNNTWSSAAGPTTNRTAFDLRTQVWYAKMPKVGPGHTFTPNLSVQTLLIPLMPFPRSATGWRIARANSPKVTTTNINDLLIGFAKSATGQSWTAGSGYTEQASASSNYLDAETGLLRTPSSYRSTFLLTARTSWQAVILARAKTRGTKFQVARITRTPRNPFI